MQYDTEILINQKKINKNSFTYFIADLASNHDGDFNRAKDLIYLAKEAGADAVKFQHFLANKIVSDYGFKNLKTKMSHQSTWKKSVYDIYKQYECDRSWIPDLVKTAKQANIDFLSTPYDYEAVDMLFSHMPLYKIGSGDITWIDFISYIAKKGKPVFLATGAADMQDVKRAVDAVLAYNRQLVLMQCNTNYTGSLDNFKYVNLNVLKTYASYYPEMLLGLSDHTPGCVSVLGAISLGARVIEKHFTDDNNRSGPDHAFSMNPKTWKEMMDRSRELEACLGDGIKRIEDNEKDTVIVQRRCLRTIKDLKKGDVIQEKDLDVLRPWSKDAIEPYKINDVIGKKIKADKQAGDALYVADLENGGAKKMLKGKYVGLRAVEEKDLEQLRQWRNNPQYRKYFREYRELSKEDQRIWFEKIVRGDKNTQMFSIEELSSGRLLGACGLCYINWVYRNADFSIYIGADNLYIDDKFAIDAANVMRTYAFEELNLHRVWAEIYDFDEKKKVFFNSLGFKLEGQHRQTYWYNNEWHDSLFYGCLKEE